jgi:protein-tyrosine phosphatase
MAEALFVSMLDKLENKPDLRIISAGTGAVKGEGASPQAMKIMEEYGLSLCEHRAALLTKKHIQEADLILAMTANHKRTVLEMDPASAGKVFTLREFVASGRSADQVLDEMNSIYKEIDVKKRHFLIDNAERLSELRAKRENLIKELRLMDQELEALEEEFRYEISEPEKRLQELKAAMPQTDIIDPFGQPLDVYRRTAKEIEAVLKMLIDKFRNEDF